VPAAITIEATGTTTPVPYGLPAATDGDGQPLPVQCTPGPSSAFRLGKTPVTCTASADGASSTANFMVTVVDTTPPQLTVPAPIVVSSKGSAGVGSTQSQLATFLGSATAQDAVDGTLPVSNDAPPLFKVGTTTVVFKATDASGNLATASVVVTVVKAAAPFRPPVDRTPPGNVRNLRIQTGNGFVSLSWTLPPDSDLARVTVFRSSPDGKGSRLVFSQRATSFSDRHLRNDTSYRYVLATFDRAGNRSSGVATIVTPNPVFLLAPEDGKVVHGPVTFHWAAVAGATYYNIQLFRNGEKIWSSWPTNTSGLVPASWLFEGKTLQLSAGRYVWFVWPGFGSLSEDKYGHLLGESSFVVG
jgi:hypothetical protein